MTTPMGPKGQLMWLVLTALVALSGLCTIFASVVTAAEAWQEHAQAQWPEVEAQIDECGLKQTSTRRRENYYIQCRLSYAIGAEHNVANLYSRTAPSRQVWQYPPNQIGPLEEWVDAHPPGTPIVVRYNPTHHAKVVLTATGMLGGPRTPSNMKLLEVFAGSFFILLTIARITRPPSLWQSARSSVP